MAHAAIRGVLFAKQKYYLLRDINTDIELP